jgi:transposase
MAIGSGIRLSKASRRQLEKFSKETMDKQEYRAARGVLLRAEGRTAECVGNELGITGKQVFMWCRKFKSDGVDGLRRKRQTGRPARQKNMAKPVIEDIIGKDPQAFGYLKGRWALRDISKELKKEGIELHYTGVRRALNELGITLKQPRLRAPGSLRKNYRKRKEIENYKRIAPALLKKG